jgi:hypothetical protein
VTTDRPGRVLVTHWPYYLSIARDARDETQRVMAENPAALPTSPIIAIIMSALAVEAFVNELAEKADMAQLGREGIPSAALDLLQDLANALSEVENDRGSPALKYQIARKVLTGHTFPRGSSPFQEFQELFNLRNLLIHLRPGDAISASGHVEPKDKLIKTFQQKGMTRTRGRKPGDPRGGTSWLQEIQTAKMADWAYHAACGIIQALGEAIPEDPPATAGIDMFRASTQTLPA